MFFVVLCNFVCVCLCVRVCLCVCVNEWIFLFRKRFYLRKSHKSWYQRGVIWKFITSLQTIQFNDTSLRKCQEKSSWFAHQNSVKALEFLCCILCCFLPCGGLFIVLLSIVLYCSLCHSHSIHCVALNLSLYNAHYCPNFILPLSEGTVFLSFHPLYFHRYKKIRNSIKNYR